MIKLLRINIKQTVRQLSMVLLLARATGTCGKQLISAVVVGKRSWPPNALGRLQYILGGISEYYNDWGVLALVSCQFSRLSAQFTLHSLFSDVASGAAAKFIFCLCPTFTYFLKILSCIVRLLACSVFFERTLHLSKAIVQCRHTGPHRIEGAHSYTAVRHRPKTYHSVFLYIATR